MTDKFKLKEYIRTVNNFPIAGIKFRDITSLIENPSAFKITCNELSNATSKYRASKIVSIESRGFIFAGSVANDLTNTVPSDTWTDPGPYTPCHSDKACHP